MDNLILFITNQSSLCGDLYAYYQTTDTDKICASYGYYINKLTPL